MTREEQRKLYLNTLSNIYANKVSIDLRNPEDRMRFTDDDRLYFVKEAIKETNKFVKILSDLEE